MFHVSASDDAPHPNDSAVFGCWNSIGGNCFRVGAGQIGRIGSRQFGEIKSKQGRALISARALTLSVNTSTNTNNSNFFKVLPPFTDTS